MLRRYMDYSTSLKSFVSVLILFLKNTNITFFSDRILFMNWGTFIISVIVSVLGDTICFLILINLLTLYQWILRLNLQFLLLKCYILSFFSKISRDQQLTIASVLLFNEIKRPLLPLLRRLQQIFHPNEPHPAIDMYYPIHHN